MSKSKAKVRYVVQCNVHGVESKTWIGRMVVVGKPTNKREKLGGCPHCKGEQKSANSAA